MNDYLSISEAKQLAQPYETITKPSLFVHLENGRIPGIRTQKKWLIEASFVRAAINWRKQAYTVEECIKKYEEQHLEEHVSSHDQDQIVRKNKSFRSESPYQFLFCGKHFIEADKLSEFMTLINNQLMIRHAKESAIPIKAAASMMETNHYRLLKAITEGKIPAFLSNNQWYLEKNVVSEYIRNKRNYSCVFDTAVKLSKEVFTVFDPEDRNNRLLLNRYLKTTEFKDQIFTSEECGIIYEEKRFLFFPVTLVSEIENVISTYMRTFGNSEERLALYKNHSWAEMFPRTEEALNEYCENKKPAISALLKNILIQTQTKEIMEYSNEELSVITSDAKSTKRGSAEKGIKKFLNFVRENYDCSYTIEFFESKETKGFKRDNVYPYTKQQYIEVGRMAFNDEYIAQSNVIEKAIKNVRLSYTWYYTQMIFVGAFRKNDIDSSLPILTLPYSREETIQRIRDGVFDADAVNLSIRFESEVNQSLIGPHKTKDIQNQRSIIINIPSSLRKPFGICYAIYCYHKQKQRHFSTFLRGTQFISLFGERYRKTIGESVFLNRRGNKSFIDYVSQDVEKRHGINSQIMGHAVAEFSRAHVRGSTSTSKYLTTQLDGLSVNDITKLLFESGTCSFIPHYLLQIIYGEKYTKTSVDIQNSIIVSSQLTPYKSERLTKLLDDAFHRSRAAVQSIMKGATRTAQKELAKEVLYNLIDQTALGKQPGVNCLLAARRLPCAYLGRDCAGCIYGIYETSFFYMAVDYVKKQYRQLKTAKTEGEFIKWESLLEHETLPSLAEIITIAENTYKMNISEYKDLIFDLIETEGGTNIGTMDI